MEAGDMYITIRFLLTAILLLATGCAAPMTKVVSTRQGETIDQRQFEKGDKVKVTYEDEYKKITTKKGRVLRTDDDSVTLDVGMEGPINLEYRRIHTFSQPMKVDCWFGSLSTGTFLGLHPFLNAYGRFTGIGISSRYMPYSNRAFEAVLIGGEERDRYSTWLSMTLNAHIYTIMPRTYFLFGIGGIIWPRATKSDCGWGLPCIADLNILRLGLGVENPISKRFNARVEADLLGGLSVYLERRFH